MNLTYIIIITAGIVGVILGVLSERLTNGKGLFRPSEPLTMTEKNWALPLFVIFFVSMTVLNFIAVAGAN